MSAVSWPDHYPASFSILAGLKKSGAKTCQNVRDFAGRLCHGEVADFA